MPKRIFPASVSSHRSEQHGFGVRPGRGQPGPKPRGANRLWVSAFPPNDSNPSQLPVICWALVEEGAHLLWRALGTDGLPKGDMFL